MSNFYLQLLAYKVNESTNLRCMMTSQPRSQDVTQNMNLKNKVKRYSNDCM